MTTLAKTRAVTPFAGGGRVMETTLTTYAEFLQRKTATAPAVGLTVPLEAISPVLYPFQRQLVQWALRKGRAALFADTGLGKTRMQCEWARLTGQRTLIVAPLAVAQQTVREAAALGITVTYARRQDQAGDGLTITNYEMLDHFDAGAFGAVVLDESSILKGVDSKTRGKLIEMFRATPYRLACTATPAPNDIAELANHAEFMGVCTREEMLSMFFVHDESDWRLKGHAHEAFHRWMASWAMMVKLPSDIGFPDDGYVLPPLTVTPEWVEGDALAVAQASGQLFPTGLKGITGRTAARRLTVAAKVERAASIVNGSQEQWIVWCGLNDEGQQLAAAVPGSVLVEGKDSLEAKVGAIEGFLSGQHRVMVTKASIAGWGLNLQHCHNMLFLGLNDSYESYYQAIRRCWRFGQTRPVNVRVVLSDLERPVLENVQRKESQAAELSQQMVRHVSEYQRGELGILNISRNGYHEDETVGDGYRMLRGDCVDWLRRMDANSVDLSVFSPPFLSLYVYSDSERDMGNSRTGDEFFQHFGFLVSELWRVMKRGRNVACHVSQVPAKLITDGYIGLKDFRGDVIHEFECHGFIYHGEVCIDKDPQAQAIRTKSKGLLFAQLRKDASWLRPAMADYILVFRKPGENAVPILPDLTNDEWIQWARPIWYGIREADTLHVAEARAEQDERHVAPLQLGTIERCIRLWSNKGETVLSPFAGIGSEGYVALRNGRRFVGVELKQKYYETAVRNLERAITRNGQGKLL